MRRLVWLASFVLVLSAVPLGAGAASPAAPVTAAPQCGSEPGQQAQAPRDAATTRVPPVSCLANSGAGAVKGDFNDDGIADLAIGVPFEDVVTFNGNVADAGAVNILYGSTS